MTELRRLIDDGICPLVPVWRSLLLLELTFLVLLAIATLLSSGRPSVAVTFSLALILPTSVGLLGIIYYCMKQ